MKVNIWGEETICHRAIKQNNDITLLDEKGLVIAEYKGVNCFEGISVTGGKLESRSGNMAERLDDIEVLMADVLGGAI